MAKQASLTKAPNPVPFEFVEEHFTLVTDENKTEILVKGRPVYVFKKGRTKFVYLGCFDIRPRMVKGILITTGHPVFGNCTTRVNENEDKEEYLKSIQSVVKTHIKNGNLYYQESDKLITYQTVQKN